MSYKKTLSDMKRFFFSDAKGYEEKLFCYGFIAFDEIVKLHKDKKVVSASTLYMQEFRKPLDKQSSVDKGFIYASELYLGS